VIVSNHDGRQVDGAVAALDALLEIVETVADQIPVLFDSGIQRGKCHGVGLIGWV
jgi:lactate 2-monooxygenase